MHACTWGKGEAGVCVREWERERENILGIPICWWSSDFISHQTKEVNLTGYACYNFHSCQENFSVSVLIGSRNFFETQMMLSAGRQKVLWDTPQECLSSIQESQSCHHLCCCKPANMVRSTDLWTLSIGFLRKRLFSKLVNLFLSFKLSLPSPSKTLPFFLLLLVFISLFSPSDPSLPL